MTSAREGPPLSPSATLRFRTVARVLDDHNVSSLVEVGPGMGATSARIARERVYVGYEPDPDSHAIAAQRLLHLGNAVVHNQPLPHPTPGVMFDALVAFEVLEHIRDDHLAIRQWLGWVRPGGLILISVPAHQSRFGPWDEKVGHFRRYEREELAATMKSVGLVGVTIEAWGMPLGYLLDWVRQRLLARRLRAGSGPEEDTSRSGRSFQPMSGGLLISAALAPFVHAQRPFVHTNLGTGWIAWGSKES